MSRTIGIDFGTTNSAAAFVEGSEPRIIPNDRGNRLTPSVVGVTADGDTLVGEAAKNQAVVNAARTVLQVKRRMGSEELIHLGDRGYTPQEIAAEILGKIRRDAEAYLGHEIDDAVITVPAHFTDLQRRSTQEAGRLAGLRVRRVINEPTAAALAYGQRLEETANIVVYDLGGGTFDVTCLRKEGSVFTVKASTGAFRLGGMDFDREMLDGVLETFRAEYGVDLSSDPALLQQLSELTEKAKIELSSQQSALLALPFVGSGTAFHMQQELRRSGFESAIESMVERTIALTREAIQEAGWSVAEIDNLVLAGGSTRIPLVRRRLDEAIGCDFESKVNPDEIVALGAAVEAERLRGGRDGTVLKDVTPYALGVEIEGRGYVSVIGRNAQLPAEGRKVFTTVADNQRSVEIHVLQGDSHTAGANVSLGRFLLTGIRPAKQGTPRIEVRFRLDEDGIAHVRARDVDTGSQEYISVAPVPTDEESDAAGAAPRVRSLVQRVRTLQEKKRGVIDAEFDTEVRELLEQAHAALERNESDELAEFRAALETVLTELNEQLRHTEHAGLGQGAQ